MRAVLAFCTLYLNLVWFLQPTVMKCCSEESYSKTACPLLIPTLLSHTFTSSCSFWCISQLCVEENAAATCQYSISDNNNFQIDNNKKTNNEFPVSNRQIIKSDIGMPCTSIPFHIYYDFDSSLTACGSSFKNKCQYILVTRSPSAAIFTAFRMRQLVRNVINRLKSLL